MKNDAPNRQRRWLLQGLSTSILLGLSAKSVLAIEQCYAPKSFWSGKGKFEDSFRSIIADLPIFDVHTHVLNANDVPVYHFVLLVVSNLTEFDSEALELTQDYAGDVFRNSFALLERAPSIEQDLASIKPVKVAGRFRPKRPPQADAYFDRLMNGNDERGLNAIAFQTYGTETIGENEKKSLLKDFFPNWLPAGKNRLTDKEFSRITASDSRAEMRVVADFVGGHGHSWRRIKDFLWSMQRSRIKNFQDMRRLYGAANKAKRRKHLEERPAVSSFGVAMLDFDYWLNSRDVPSAPTSDRWYPLDNPPPVQAPLIKQIKFMSELHKLYPGEALPIVPFCPWRQADDRNRKSSTTALDLVKRAMDSGFIGVKLYPPMGFRPMGNAGFDDRDDKTARWPSHYTENKDGRFKYGKMFGAELDESLSQLYDLCAQADFPIMSHTGFGNAARQIGMDKSKDLVSTGEFANPRYWRLVLEQEKWKDLRINLAHFGFLRMDWRHDIGVLMRKHSRVYADVGHFEELLVGDKCESARCFFGEVLDKGFYSDFEYSQRLYAEIYAEIVASKTYRPPRCKDAKKVVYVTGERKPVPNALWQRIMYGSDHFMIQKEHFSSDYLDVVSRSYYAAMGNRLLRDEYLRAFLSGNAAQFYGLTLSKDGKASQNRERLLKFYNASSNFDAVGFFSKYDVIVSKIAAKDPSYRI